jgi:Flp pilus assembly protein TadG
MALLCPFLAFMMVVAIDYCRVFHLTQTVESAAQNAALYAAGVSTPDPDTFATQIAAAQQVALDEGSLLSPALTAANVTVTVNNNIATATVTYTFSTITRIPGLPSTMTVTRTVDVPVVPQNPGYAYVGNTISSGIGGGGAAGGSSGSGGGTSSSGSSGTSSSGTSSSGSGSSSGSSGGGSCSNSGCGNCHSGCGFGCNNCGRQCDPCD